MEGMEAGPKREQERFFGTQPTKKTSPGWMALTPRAGMGDSLCRFRRYH